MSPALHTSMLSSLPLLARGKVRDNYAVGDDRILMVASDRLSAFDVIMGEPIPGKGALLTQMALFWFDKLGPKGLAICPIHLTGEAPESVVTPAEVVQVAGRSMLVKRLKPLPVEAVVRGYLAGSGWKEYQHNQAVCGVALPPGLQNASKLPTPIYTPAAKAAVGEHDENITFDQTVAMIGADLATLRGQSLSRAAFERIPLSLTLQALTAELGRRASMAFSSTFKRMPNDPLLERTGDFLRQISMCLMSWYAAQAQSRVTMTRRYFAGSQADVL
jgi:phosphoribosylaminoimidazole-succinocarboxamide synthase